MSVDLGKSGTCLSLALMHRLENQFQLMHNKKFWSLLTEILERNASYWKNI